MQKHVTQIEDYGIETFIPANEEQKKTPAADKGKDKAQKRNDNGRKSGRDQKPKREDNKKPQEEQKEKPYPAKRVKAEKPKPEKAPMKSFNTPTTTVTATSAPVAPVARRMQAQNPEDQTETPEDDKELAMNLYLTETILVFKGAEFLLNDLTKKSGWKVGKCDNQILTVDEDSSIVMVDPQKHQTNACQAIATGGCKDFSTPGNLVLSLDFQVVQRTAGDHYVCSVTQTIQPLRTARYMHQSAIIKGKNNAWHLLVAGGKAGARSWLNTVEMLDLSPYFRPGQMKTAEDGTTTAVQSEWIQCASMTCARSNFALVPLSNFVYVYGGISGAGEGEKAHHPQLAAEVIERYTPKADKWEVIKIAAAPRLAAFSWTRLSTRPGHEDEAKIAILGGTDGDIATEDFMIVDFTAETAMKKQTNFEFNTCMGHMLFHEETQMLHHIGGMGSGGVDFKMKLGETEWTQSDKNHSVVLNASGLELMNNSAIYFD